MAATLADSIALSCSSCAPTEFHVLSSFDSRTTISVAVEHCQLCGGSRRPFYCRDCLKAGDFQRSDTDRRAHKNQNIPESQSYADKRQKWLVLKEERLKILERFHEKVAEQHRCILKKSKLKLHKERTELLKLAIHNAQKLMSEDLQQLNLLRKKNETTLENISSCKHDVKDMSETIQAHQKRLFHITMRQEKKNNEILSWRQTHIRHLVQYIFPVEAVQQKSESDTMMKARVSMLAEARHTAYVKGRWIKGHSEWEEMYRIVQPVLPGNGDYNLCCASVLEGVDSVPQSNLELSQKNELWNIMAGLCFATQMVHQLAFYLGVRLPWNLQVREFCWAEMTEKQLNTAVFKLNCNIIHLCYTQNVNLEGLHPRHTICNIRALLDHPDVGRSIVSTDTDSMNAIEDSLLNGGEDLDLSDSMEKLDVSEREWEHVPASLPELEMPTRTASTSYFSATVPTQSRTSQETQSTMTSLASGLVTSAITSIWRGWGKSDK